MRETVLQQIEDMVAIIYSIDKQGLDKAFVELIDNLLKLVDKEQLEGNEGFNQVLLNLQESYIKKDLVELADVLQYQLRLFLEEGTVLS